MEGLKQLKTTDNRIALLNSLHIYTLLDLIYHLPYRYEVIEEVLPTYESDKIVIEGEIINAPKVFFKGRMSRMTLHILSHSEDYQVTIFNRHFLRQYLQVGKKVVIIGKCNEHSITASDLKLNTMAELSGIHPIYSLKPGITSKALQGYIKKAFVLVNDSIDDIVPYDYKEKYHLLPIIDSLKLLHFPPSFKAINNALKTFKYYEFLQFQLTVQYIKKQREQEIGIAKTFDQERVQAFIHSLPFSLTEDQNKAVSDILDDLSSPKMMYRFVQGDVGSGKTVVSTIAIYASYLAGFQSALMAPTEVLAQQHYVTLKNFFKGTDVRVGLLVGSMSHKEKQTFYETLENGEIDVVVGTHALFQDKVTYQRLGLVITDEQHRFGVEQRKALKGKGDFVDFLVMSATPIPRTLAISMYGDMDVSTIKSMPSGRKPIITQYFKTDSMKPFLKDLKEYLERKGQCYVICPLIDDNDSSLKSASQIAEAMQKYFISYKVGLMHGQLKQEDKDALMTGFKENKIQILVSTTVIEVGIDVKNANMMVIYNAERFGMSQIHQLRGRVGRGSEQGYCFLLSKAQNEEATQRLSFLESHYDGFEISTFDLKMRGPGEMLGSRQSGVPTFVMADVIKDFDILKAARNDAIEIINHYYKYDEYVETIKKIQENLKEGNEYID